MTDPISALLAAIPGLAKAGAEIASASDEAKRNAQLIDIQRVIIHLQSSITATQVQNSSLPREKDDLKKQIVGIKNWEGEKQRWTLVTIWEGAVAYALKKIWVKARTLIGFAQIVSRVARNPFSTHLREPMGTLVSAALSATRRFKALGPMPYHPSMRPIGIGETGSGKRGSLHNCVVKIPQSISEIAGRVLRCVRRNVATVTTALNQSTG